MTAGWVSDEVWAQMDPRAGRLTRRGRITLAAGTLAAAALVIAVWLAGASGLVRPRLSVEPAWSGTFSLAQHTFSQTVKIDNHGWTDTRLLSATTTVPGLRVTGVTGLPRVLAAGASATITVHYAVVDCGRHLPRPPAFGVRVSKWWGTATVPLAADDIAPSPLATSACHGKP